MSRHGSTQKASADGCYHYEKTVSLSALQAAFTKRFVYVHSIFPAKKLPTTVASLDDIPAQASCV
jgi:hypothetical protein